MRLAIVCHSPKIVHRSFLQHSSNGQRPSGYSKNPRFWHARKTPRLMLPQTLFKTLVVVERFVSTVITIIGCIAEIR
jgi:hypothetical protein